MATRTLLRDFQLANIGLIGCTLTVYTVDAAGAKTSTKATLYDSLTGSGTLSNPQGLDSEGKAERPIYHDVPVVCEVTGAHVATVNTGAIFPGGSYRGDWVTATLYLPGDFVTDGANGDGTNDFYRVANYHTSGIWATDKANTQKLVRAIDMSTLTDQVVDSATESLAGIAEIATQGETDAGTDDERFITPLKLANKAISNIADAIVTAAKLASSVFSGLTAVAPAAGDYVAISDVSDSGNPKKALVGDLFATQPRFSANKNGTNQTGVTSATEIKVTFTTEVTDVGSYYDAANSRFTPPAGTYLFTARVPFTVNVVDQAAYYCALYKNGAAHLYGPHVNGSGTGTIAPGLALYAEADGDDYFELYAYGAGAGDKTISGTVGAAYFQAARVA